MGFDFCPQGLSFMLLNPECIYCNSDPHGQTLGA